LIGDEPYFAGRSYGFATRSQRYTKDPNDPDFDIYVYRYQWDHDSSYNCLYEQVIPNQDMRDQITYYSSTSFRSALLMTMFEKDSDVRKTLMDDYFYPYSSRYSGGFSLLDTMVIPRPCAYKSYNMTQVDYYRGQNPL